LAEVGNFSPNPDIAQDFIRLEQLAQVVAKSGDGKNQRLKRRKVEFEHGLKYTPFEGLNDVFNLGSRDAETGGNNNRGRVFRQICLFTHYPR